MVDFILYRTMLIKHFSLNILNLRTVKLWVNKMRNEILLLSLFASNRTVSTEKRKTSTPAT